MSSQHSVNHLIYPALETDKLQGRAWKTKDYAMPVTVNHDACYGGAREQEHRLWESTEGRLCCWEVREFFLENASWAEVQRQTAYVHRGIIARLGVQLKEIAFLRALGAQEANPLNHFIKGTKIWNNRNFLSGCVKDTRVRSDCSQGSSRSLGRKLPLPGLCSYLTIRTLVSPDTYLHPALHAISF